MGRQDSLLRREAGQEGVGAELGDQLLLGVWEPQPEQQAPPPHLNRNRPPRPFLTAGVG
jgi:hypothetical protein